MFSDFLICIFSYNRGDFLENLLSSMDKFYPEAALAIFDDGSDDPKVKSILKNVLPGTYIHVTDKTIPGCKHGGLYNMMNTAIEYAKNSSFKYAYFVQDDMQFLWRDERLNEKIKSAFNRSECMMCNSSFLQKILVEGIEQRLPILQECLFSFAGNGVADTGIINISKAREADLHFYEQSESGNGAYWHKRGYRLYWLPQPHLAWVPWPTTFRNKNKQSRKPRFLNPLSTDKINKLTGNNSYAYLEDYTSIQGWAIKPYWYTASPGLLNLLKIYFKYYLRS